MILSDFHPLSKCIINGNKEINYFDKEYKNGGLAYKQFFDVYEQHDFPEVSIRLYILSEIINSVITSGFK
jgi:hypothetical protein